MKKIISAILLNLLISNWAQANTVVRFAGTNTQYNTWSEKSVYPCYAAVKTTSTGYEVMISYDRSDLRRIEGQKFVFLKSEITHPASDDAYADVPINFSNDQYYAYSRIKGFGTLRMALLSANGELRISRSEGFQFTPEKSIEFPGSYHCMNLKKLSSY